MPSTPGRRRHPRQPSDTGAPWALLTLYAASGLWLGYATWHEALDAWWAVTLFVTINVGMVGLALRDIYRRPAPADAADNADRCTLALLDTARIDLDEEADRKAGDDR